MLIYDVFYYRGDRRLPAMDIEVSDRYLDGLEKILRKDEWAYAECKNGGRFDSKLIDPHGVKARLDREQAAREAREAAAEAAVDTIHNGCVRLFEDGRVEHWDGMLSTWRPGFGPWATHVCLGADRDVLKQWRQWRDR